MKLIPVLPTLDASRHKEDTVREEIIVPILKALGYTLEGEHRIERSIRLKHPYIMTGSRRFPLTLVPDYLLYRFGEPFCVLDAKAPGEDIYSGDNVQQAFGYAIHPEVRVQLFALCNGTDLAIHHVSTDNPTMRISIDNISGYWPNLNRMLGTDGKQDNLLPDGFMLDYGIFSEKLGFHKNQNGEHVIQFFQFVHFSNLRRAEDDLYVSNTVVDHGDGQRLFLTLAFGAKHYARLLEILPDEVATQLAKAMKRWPYDCAINTPKPIYVSVVGVLSDQVYTSTESKYDQYRPLMITEVLENTSHFLH